MSRSKVVHYLLCFILLFGILGGSLGNWVVFADEEPPPGDKIELSCKYPTFEGKSGENFEFEVELKWLGGEARAFDLAIMDVPLKWSAAIVTGDTGKQIPEIVLEPEMRYPKKIKVRFAPLSGEFPEPGDYTIALEASSGDIKETIELKAVVTGIYMFAFYTASGRLNTEVTAGEENHLSIMVFNTGTAVIEKIDLMSSKPSGWTITFNPDTVESLEPGLVQEVDAIIAPPRKTVVGDYAVTMKAVSADMSAREIELRVTIQAPTIMAWVSILIIVAVIAGLAVLFWRLGRR